MSYDFSHWGKLPKVSCICPTYGRPFLVEEAVESFIRQDYPGEKELIIVNDYKHTLKISNSEIFIYNLPERTETLGKKLNLCCGYCTGEIILPWDDDDISLPWRISVTIQHMTNHKYFKPQLHIFMQDHKIINFFGGVDHNMSGFSKELFYSVGKYNETAASGIDTLIEGAINSPGYQCRGTIPLEELFYIYRWGGTNSYHGSAYGTEMYKAAADWVRNQGCAEGIVELKPHWNMDYVSMYKEFLTTYQQVK